MSNGAGNWDVRFEFDANGQWQLEETFGPTNERSAKAFYQAAIEHPLMHDGEVVDRHD
jgi:hypothetical protein